MATNEGGPAFPRPASKDRVGESGFAYPHQEGMSLLDWFAGQAMMGIASLYNRPVPPEHWAKQSYEAARAMLEEKNRQSQG